MLPRKVAIVPAVDSQIAQPFDPYIVADVNESQVKVAKFGEMFEWHHHPHEDEAFFVLRGRIAIDFEEGAVELAEGEFLVVPRGVSHRPRSLTHEPVVMMVEPASTLNTGAAVTELTVAAPKRLQPG
ncbi:cupin domain-containing protein [Phenylobacterium sp.]|uniref:cupin domain-containing protein n=1 Tax=Phenylobacterium sp. TaxID=1871053 RepID=UPI0035B15D5C